VSVDGIPLLAAVLLLGASAFVAWEAGASHPARLVAQILVGAGLGGLPATLIFDQCKRWRPDFGFMALMVGFAIGISFGMLGTAAAGRVGAGRPGPGLELVGAAVGACVGTFLAFVTVCDKERDLLTEPLVIVLAALLVGSFATLGHQISSGGPRRFSSRGGRIDSRSSGSTA
jgi:CDP-diglyceride synthetase